MKTKLTPVIFLVCTLILTAQEQTNNSLQTINSSKQYVSIREGNILKSASWRLAPDANPDIYEVSIKNEEPLRVVFITDRDSLEFDISINESIDFVINWNGQRCVQRLMGKKHIPAATFTPEYIRKNKGKISVSVPKVYELINIAMAISDFGRENKNRIYLYSNYRNKVLEWFDPYKNHALIKKIDSAMASNSFNYANVKMNAYSFEFDKSGNIHRSPIFDRTGFYNQKSNYLLPFLKDMQAFAQESNFLEFYRLNRNTYDRQIAVYNDSIGLPDMQKWLEFNFPDSNGYDFYNVVFSPLVSYHQSATWFESNGFRELQPHVNFPYKRDARRMFPLSKTAEYTYRGNIVFTELNHGYINPLGEMYKEQIRNATSNTHLWARKNSSAINYSDHYLFNEYLNWGLINLRVLDVVPQEEQQKLTDRVDLIMTKHRGFIKFTEFSAFFMNLYKNRTSGTSIADLYPEVIEWFAHQNLQLE
jgi:hypothetical protein